MASELTPAEVAAAATVAKMIDTFKNRTVKSSHVLIEELARISTRNGGAPLELLPVTLRIKLNGTPTPITIFGTRFENGDSEAFAIVVFDETAKDYDLTYTGHADWPDWLTEVVTLVMRHTHSLILNRQPADITRYSVC